MINLQGIPVNIQHELVGRTEKKDSWRTDGDETISFLVRDRQLGLRFVVTSASREESIARHKGLPLICEVERVQMMNIGDIVLVETTGLVNIVYQRRSNDNSILVTHRCNAKCVTCPQPPRNKKGDETLLNLKLISLMDKDTSLLALTGGEPTLLKENLLRVMTACKTELPKTSLILLTNGIALEDFDFVKALVSVAHPDFTVAVSLNSDVDSEHNRMVGNDSFYRTLKGIHNLALFRQKIEIRTVIHKLTYQRLPNLAEFICRNFPFVVHVALMGLEPLGWALDNIEQLWIDPYDYRDTLKNAVQVLHRNNLKVSIYNHQLCILLPSLRRFARKSIGSWKAVYLDMCEQCELKDGCGGLFASAQLIHSSHLQPLTENGQTF